MELDFAARLNIFTGDNGLGKSFLLDVAWWALTRRWLSEVNPSLTSGLMARPLASGEAEIEFRFSSKTRGKEEKYRSTFDRGLQSWTGRAGRPANPGLVIYAQVDGGFSVWDPHRNYWRKAGGVDVQDRLPAYVFSSQEIWTGLRIKDEVVCNGLLADWVLWQKGRDKAFKQLVTVLKTLSPEDGPIEPAAPKRISLNDVREIPTIQTPYGPPVPVLMASAAVRRVLALAYLIVWSWQEHLRAGELLDRPPTTQITFLIDEVECHLHPKWQRTIMRSLLGVLEGLKGKATEVQVLAATHSPLLLASLETSFRPDRDAWFDLDLIDGQVRLAKRKFVAHGEASNWLTSEAFNLKAGRSLESERALEAAREFLRSRSTDARAAGEVHRLLLGAGLPDIDPFWVRWLAHYRQLGGPE